MKIQIKKFKDLPVEIWKPVRNYSGIYEVSNFGRVRSLDRTVVHCNGFKQKIKGRILRPGISVPGYRMIQLCKDGKQKNGQVHQLVADAFIKTKPKKCKYEVMHLDNNRLNNNIENLRYGSRLCNCAFRRDYGTNHGGVNHYRAKFTVKDILRIRKLCKNGEPRKKFQDEFGVSQTCIAKIVTGKTYQDVTEGR